MDHKEYSAMMAALEGGTATVEQQNEAHGYIVALRRQHAKDLRESERDALESYSSGRHDGNCEANGHDFGPGIY